MNPNTKAETVADAPLPLNLPQSVTATGGIMGAAITLVVGFLALRKRWSRDNLELTKDRAETNIIDTLEQTIKELRAERDKQAENAREAWRYRAGDAKLIGELTAKVEHLTTINESLETHVELLTSMVRHMLPEPDRKLFENALKHHKLKGNHKHETQQTPATASRAEPPVGDGTDGLGLDPLHP